MDAEKPVSLREFARMTGTSDGAVRKAIGRGSIKEGVTPAGKILPSVAAAEWGKDLLPVSAPDQEAVVAADLPAAAVVDLVQAPVIEMVGEEPVVSSSAEVSDADVAATDGLDDDSAADIFSKKILSNTTKVEAERLISIFKAKKAQRDLEIQEHKYVPADTVYEVLFEVAQMIRDGIMTVPERVVDNVRAVDTRAEGVVIIREELIVILDRLSKLADLKLYKE